MIFFLVPMGIQKIQHKNSRWHKISSSCGGKGKDAADDPVLGADTGDDFDGREGIEPGSEPCMVEGQMCSIPYELYDLRDLREILSMETWNSCLTEEERFHLSAYLPDMDQHTFCLTLKGLFDGSNMNFGNPVDNFFKGLKAGFYTPKVTCLRENLQFLQRKRYYHTLRSYHDRMVKMFVEMRMLWDQCENTLGVEERISMWRKKRNQRRVDLLDLNKFPKDDHLLSEEINFNTKGVIPKESKTEKDIFSTLSTDGMTVLTSISRAKGVDKMKPPGNSTLQNHHPKLSSADVLAQSQTAPKGLLKIVPKVPYVRLEQSAPGSRGAQPNIPLRNQGLQDFKFSPLPASLRLGNVNNLHGSQFPKQKIDSTRIYSRMDQPPCLLNQQESIIRSNKPLECYTRRTRMAMPAPIDKVGLSLLGKHKLFGSELGSHPDTEYKLKDPVGARRYPFSGENLWPDLVTGAQDFSLKALESYPFGIGYHGNDQCKANHPGFGEVIPRISGVGIANQDNLMSSSSEQLKGNGSVLPLTYKRRKALAKVNSLDIGKEVKAEADLKKHAIPRESNQQQLTEGSKMKIKFLG